jgi:hypothetical protein
VACKLKEALLPYHYLFFSPSFSLLKFPEMPFVQVERDSNKSYAIITLNRKPVNALNEELINELLKAISDLENDKTVKGFILASVRMRFTGRRYLNFDHRLLAASFPQALI